ncbi:MAG: diguanylate cyclase [Oscillospiraceae bacterium]|jgi:diguanylate cyclase (GGDEF)-like protein/PAS domain S-box-containing protein|nr:diguanylate cyclase [Oscillospiraceae bacterium]
MKIGLKPLLSVVLLATILIPAGAAVFTGVSAAAQQHTQVTTAEVHALSYAQAVGLDVVVDECAISLHSLARFEEIKLTAGGNFNAVRDEVVRLFDSVTAASPHLLNVIIIDVNGTVRIDAFENAGAHFGAFAEAEELSRSETLISNITIADPNYGGENTFFVLTHINEDEVILGYICMVYSTEIFKDYLRTRDLFAGEGNFFVTDRKGTALWIDNSPVVRQGQANSPPLNELISNTITTVRRDVDSGTIDSATYIGAYGTINGNKNNIKNGWFWYGTFPVSEIDTFPLPMIIIVSVVAVVSVLFVLFALGTIRRVTIPLHDIVIKMRRINEGDMNERLDVKGTDEYAYISESFNEMLDEVLISGEMHRTISELSDNMLFEWDFKKQVLFVSDNFMEMFEIETERATLTNGRFIESLMEKEDAERYSVDINKLFRNLDSMNGEYQVETKTGSMIWISVRSHCVLDRLGELLRVIGVITNINSEKLLSLQLSERASYDFLSGLFNRNTFMRELQSEITRSATSRVGVIFIDVDDFKFINDTYGHDTGDEIIKTVADIIKDKLGSAGFAGRFGGDEFVMCVTEEQTLNNIDKLATAVLEMFDKGYHAEKHNVTLKIKASLGIAITPDHGRDNETVLAAADEAMYFVKKNGKCNFHIYNPEDSVLTELMHSI